MLSTASSASAHVALCLEAEAELAACLQKGRCLSMVLHLIHAQSNRLGRNPSTGLLYAFPAASVSLYQSQTLQTACMSKLVRHLQISGGLFQLNSVVMGRHLSTDAVSLTTAPATVAARSTFTWQTRPSGSAHSRATASTSLAGLLLSRAPVVHGL